MFDTAKPQPAPAFSLPNQDGKTVSLDDLKGNKTILFFYPAALTPGCTKEACDFRDSMSSLKAHGYNVVGISRDLPEKLRQFRERDGLNFDLLSDPEHTVHSAYGAWGKKMNYGKEINGVIRSTFVLDEEGRMVHELRNVKATGHVGRVRKLLGIDQ